ncbi:hypothetical protein [Teredinibacter turnerae]|uniref:hypothetical protein n=1 Tax=Teredinibacter turnerae TaxID=2426 RepID=UPI00035CB3E8|nr:hypothetical protein [Teredinibacter turnerae]
MTKKVEVRNEREVKSYAEFWHTSLCLLEMTNVVKEGHFHLVMGSLVFTAFTLEAYLNHIGSIVFKCWADLERLSPKEKLNVIAEKIEIEVDYGKRPWQSLTQLFQFRNDIAHGKTHTITKVEIETLEKHNKYYNPWDSRARTRWEEYCTQSNAERAREDVREIVGLILAAAKVENEYPFSMGLEYGGSTLLQG